MTNKTPDDLALFMAEMEDVAPLKSKSDSHAFAKDQTVTLAQQERRKAAEKELEFDPNYLSQEYVDLVAPDDIISFKKSGVQEGVFKNLRLGKYPIDATLNLSGKNIQEARSGIFEFINDCLERNIRTVLINHGMGKYSKPHPAIIKSYTNKWLQEFEEVLAFHTAQKHHGSYSAAYVLLKKSEKQKAANRERHQKK